MDLWAIAVYDFGLTDDQFWKLTPLKFDALSRRHDAARRATDLQTAKGCWAVVAASGAKKKDGSDFTPLDFLPRYDGDDRPEEADPTPPADRIKSTLTAAFPLPPHMEWARGG